jgi:RNA polymerase sigma factor (sigma-70 family)
MSPITHAMQHALRELGSASALSDRQLLDRFVTSQEHHAFEELMRRHGPMVLRVCRRVLQHPQDAEDAFQATFIVLMRRAARIANPDSVSSWLHGVALRVAMKLRSSHGQQHRHQSLNNSPPEIVQVSPEPARPGQDLHLLLDEELHRLPEKYRAPIVLCYLEGKSNREAARQLQCETNALQKRLSRAREMLRHRLVRRGLATSAIAWVNLLALEQAPAATLPTRLTNPVVLLLGGHGPVPGAASPQVVALADAVAKDLARRLPRWGLAVFLLVGLALVVTVLILPSPWGIFGGRSPALSERVVLQPFLAGCSALAISPDGRFLAAGGQSVIHIWNVRDRKHVASLTTHKSLVSSLAFTRDGNFLVSGSHDRTVKVWDARTWKESASLQGASAVTSIAVSPDGETLVVGTKAGATVWDLQIHRQKSTLVPASDPPSSTLVAFTGDGRTIAVGSQNITLWDARTLEKRHTITTGTVRALACSPDGRTLAWTEQGGPLVTWDLQRMKQRGANRDLSTTSIALGFAPNGRKLVLGSLAMRGKNMSLVDGTSCKLDSSMPAHVSDTSAVVFSRDGKTLASASWDGTVKLWDVLTPSDFGSK